MPGGLKYACKASGFVHFPMTPRKDWDASAFAINRIKEIKWMTQKE